MCHPRTSTGSARSGTSVDATPAAIDAATTVIAQLNAGMPRTLGDAFVHVSQIDFGVEVDVPPYQVPPPPIGDVERRIGEYVAELVPDRAVLQMGIGAIPAAVGMALRDKRDLGVHTEMFTDVLVDLVEAGAVSGALQGDQPRQDRDRVHDGHRASVPLRGRQPDGRDAARATTPTTPP